MNRETVLKDLAEWIKGLKEIARADEATKLKAIELWNKRI